MMKNGQTNFENVALFVTQNCKVWPFFIIMHESVKLSQQNTVIVELTCLKMC